MDENLKRILDDEKRNKTGVLKLYGFGLTCIPEDIKNMTWLNKLHLANNNITVIQHLDNLTNLHTLYLFNNKIKDITGLEKLLALERLDLADNKIDKIQNLSNCIQLSQLYLSRNPVSNIDQIVLNAKLEKIFLDGTLINSIKVLLNFIKAGLVCSLDSMQYSRLIYLKDCPLSDDLLVLIQQGPQEIINYLEQLEEQGEDLIYEARLLILGEAGVGKTTLARKLYNLDSPMPDAVNDTTVGIDISTIIFPKKSDNKPEFRVNVWDFGGQQIYHSTHQLFMSRRSLYVIIGNGRQEDDPELYWLPIQKMLGQDSPALLVINKRGEIKHEIPINQLQLRFPNLKGNLTEIDFAKDTFLIQDLLDTIEYNIRRLPQFIKGEKLPKKWAIIRQKLSELNENYITIEAYRNLCTSCGISEHDKQKYILNYMNDMGVLLYFDIEYLNRIIILKAYWLVDAIYKILDHTKERDTNGKFTENDLKLVWSNSAYTDLTSELILIMKKFELCYELPNTPKEYLVPKIVQVDIPSNLNWNYTDNLQLRYEYDVMPKGILQRLIVRKHSILSKSIKIWKYGCVFEHLGSKALVLLESSNKIIIYASGIRRNTLIDILCLEIDDINGDFNFSGDLNVKKLVPCICKLCLGSSNPTYFEYQDLIDRFLANKKEIECKKRYEQVYVNNILQMVFNQGENKVDFQTTSIFLSYSKDDLKYLIKLKEHLSFAEGAIDLWDDNKILAGKDWELEIKNAINKADIILFLVSSSLYSTKYVREIEVPLAINRLKNVGDVKVIPIIIRECAWENSIFGNLNALPRKGRPITLWEDEDKAWKEVVTEIGKIIGYKGDF